MDGALDRRKSRKATFSSELQLVARIICPRFADKFHTDKLRSIFCRVHAPAENRFDLVRHCGGELCEAFLTSCAAVLPERRLFLSGLNWCFLLFSSKS